MGTRTTTAGILTAGLLALLSAPPAQAATEECTTGNAQAILNAGPTIAQTVWFPGRAPNGNAVHAISQCRYSLFLDNQTFAFSCQDTFVGQIAHLEPYKDLAESRPAAISEITRYVDRAWIAPVLPDGTTGPLVEQTLHNSAFKNTEAYGMKAVYQNRGFATTLPPGEYVSIWESRYDGSVDDAATVHLTITP